MHDPSTFDDHKTVLTSRNAVVTRVCLPILVPLTDWLAVMQSKLYLKISC